MQCDVDQPLSSSAVLPPWHDALGVLCSISVCLSLPLFNTLLVLFLSVPLCNASASLSSLDPIILSPSLHGK